MNKPNRFRPLNDNRLPLLFILLAMVIMSFLNICVANAATPAGYSEYYIPGDEDTMGEVLCREGITACPAGYHMHTVISVTAWSDTTTVYYDHWENGYNFDPANPSTADETYTLNTGQVHAFETANIALPTSTRATCSPAGTCPYDGRDHIYVAGGVVTVTRVGWVEERGVGLQGVAWEIYPVKPQLTNYVVPFGETSGWYGFQRLNTLIQATQDNTTVTVDLNHDGTPDMLDTDRDGTPDASTILLQAGESFLLDDVSAHVAAGTMDEGAVINGSETLQVKYIAGRTDINNCTRGFSAFPRGYWTKDYYAPLDQPLPDVNNQASDTDYYLYNPNPSSITINWEADSSSGSFSIPATSTVSFRTATGGSVSIDSGLYLKGSDYFWGVGSNDANHSTGTSGYAHEWGYSLLPTTMLYTEHFLGWAPDGLPLAVGQTQMGIFLTPAQDNTHIFVDFNNDGISDQTYTLNRLQTQYISDPDGDMSGARIWATGPFSMAYGQNSHNSDNSSPALDLGYIAIPGGDFISLVLGVHESVNPQAVLTPSGSQAEFTITVNSQKYTVDGVNVTDYLPTGWTYVNNSATITRPDQTQLSGAAANPAINGSALTWSSTQVGGNMLENQEITITFTGQTTQNFTTGDISQSTVKAVGTRTVGSVTQTFTTTDFVFNTYVNSTLSMQVTKASSVPLAIPVSPGDTITYTVTATNPASSTAPLTGISIYDSLPAGVSYVAGSSQVTGSHTIPQTDNVRDNFGTQAYNHNDGSVNWASDWNESDYTQSAAAGNVLITFGELRIGRTSNIYRQANLSGATSATLTFNYRTSNNIEDGEWANIEVASSPSGPWTSVYSFQNDRTGSVNYSIPNSLWSSTTTIRFSTAGYDNNEYLYIDNVDITYSHLVPSSGTSAAGDPPVFVSSSDGYYLDPGQQMTLTYSVIVDSPLATGIDEITNTAAINCNEIILPLSASVTNIVVNPSSQSASAGDRVWFDINGNGLLDVGESGLPNIEVTLKDQYGTPLMTTTTDSTGHYLFNGINPDNGYYVEVTAGTLPVGLQQSAPAGHSDNRTDTFNLTNGQFYTNADLGYKSAAGYAAVGNIVWSDADSSGTRNPGEPGIAGVTVQICFDTNGDGTWDEDEKTGSGCMTTTTAADGTYLITGVPASGTEDYFVYVDGAQAKLTGYTRTAPSNDPLYINNLTAGDVIQYANFGYHGTTYSITDRIWFDADGNGSIDAGETGIGLVTVDLLDASLNVIASTTTDANGTYIFSGVIGGGADYTVRITDTNSKLTDYFGTTSPAITRSLQIPNLTGNIDNSSTPSFGYNLRNSVVGSVFNDLSNNGSIESGEPGISGVTVKLYNDANGNGQIDAGSDTVMATLTTDPYGNYIFSGLSNGNYIVSIEVPPSGYTYTGTDSDPVTTGQQQAASIVADGNALNKNFGYYSSAARSVAGTLWNDTNNDGVIDTGEPGIAGVTISLLQGGNLVTTTSTAADGSYSFIGLTASTYTVMITDDAGVLSGYIGTYEKTEGTTGPFDGQEIVDLSGGNQSGIDFGYVSPSIPTLAVLASFSAYEQDGNVVVQWETASEYNTLGFYLLRLDTSTGEYRSITRGLLPGLFNEPGGGIYTLVDSGAFSGSVYRYKLVEVERNGKRIAYGPFTVSVTAGNETAINAVRNSSARLTVKAISAGPYSYTRQVRRQSQVQKALAEKRQVSASTLTIMKSKSTQVTGSRIKIPVSEDGLYYVDAEDIAAATGISYTKAKKLIGRNSLSVSNQGQPVAYLPAVNNAGIYFYGTGTDSSYTRDNIYWIDKAKGVTMQNDDKTLLPLSVNPGAAFTDTMHIEQNLVQNMVQTSNPSEDFWDWDLIYLSDSYSDGPKTFTFSLNGKAETQAEATLQVRVLGGSDSGMEQDHHVVVSLNGRQIVEGWWGGLNEYVVTATFDQSILNEGENTIEVQGILDEGIPWSMFYINSFDLTYERLYKAVGNKLVFTGDGNQLVTISEFTASTPDIFLFNITDPRMPKFNTSASIDGSTGNYELSFNVASQSARYLAVSSDAAVKVVNVSGVNPSKLRAKRNAADYLIIATGELVSAAQPLAAYRKVQKMKTMVVNLDDIMNEFNFGISSPEAIREFLTYAYHNWRKSPKYVVLAGTGTWDYRDNLGAGGNLIPPALVPTSYGLSTSDNHLADIDGDHIPDMAIGRLPVSNSQELQDVIGKIKTFERTGGNKVILLADRPDEGGNFSSDSEAIAGYFPSGYTLEKVYLGEYASADTAKQVLLNYINSGAVFFNFIGHAAPDMFSTEGVLTTDDMDSLINSSGLPIITAMTCTSGEFAIPGYPSMSQLMVLKSNGGAAAFWSSTGLSDNSESGILNREFYNAVCSGQKLTLGDAVLEAFKKYGTNGSMPFMTDIYTILGDPALRLK